MSLLMLTPGPTRIPDRVLAAGARSLHHRTPEFSRVLVETLEGLRPLFGTRGEILPLHCTGRGGMEAAVANLFSAGDQFAACCNGRFGELWGNLAGAYGLRVYSIAEDWGASVDPEEVDRALVAHPGIRAVGMTYGDTSTGVLNDVAAVGAICRKRGVLLLVDCVSSLGGAEFRFDEWGADVAVVASQKCLMSAPGLSFAAVSDRAKAASGRSTLPRMYFDFQAIRASLGRTIPEPPGTPPVQVFLQVHEALRMIQEEGVNAFQARHERMGRICRDRAREIGLRLQFPALERFSPTLTCFTLPAGADPAVVRGRLRERGILTARGLGKFEATGFRIGHMGDIRPDEVSRAMDAVAEVLVQPVP